jgi:gliding motility-associated-like protein
MRIVSFLICVGISFLSFSKPPARIKFIENKNQWKRGTDFVSRIPGGEMHVRAGSFTYYFLDYRRINEYHEYAHLLENVTSESRSEILIDGVKVNVTFVGANRSSIPSGISQSKEYYNYLLGNDQEQWAIKAYAYDGFLYPEIYPGVNLKVYASDSNVKYDFIVAPGSDPSQIKISYDGIDRLIAKNGDVHAQTALGDVIEKSPVAYQIINGKKVFVKCEFAIDGQTLRFVFPDQYDLCNELVIDPLLIFSTLSGSAADNWGSTATPGENATLYSAGITSHRLTNGIDSLSLNGTYSGTFPATAGAFQTTYGGEFDVAILKFDSLGTNLLYATYLGGRNCESPHSLIVNGNNELVILGTTESTDFPVSSKAYKKVYSGGTPVNSVFYYEQGTDIFVTKLSADGTTLLGSTFIGGAENDGGNFVGSELRKNYGDDLRGDLITDPQGNIYISSVTQSPGLATINAYQGGFSDALLVKLSPDLSQVVWSRYVGGSSTDAAHTIKFSDNHIYIAGGTTSTDFPIVPGAAQPTHAGGVDGWIAKVSMDGKTIVDATYTGSANFDMIYFLDVNATGDVYVYGQTDGNRPIFPDDIYRDQGGGQFIQKFTADLSQALFYTVFGSGKGSPDISPTAFLVNDCNNLYMAGWGGNLNLSMDGGGAFGTSTLPLQVTADAYQKTTEGHDFYLLVMSPDAKEKLYATFLGGGANTHVDGGTSRFDKHGVVYHAVCAGCGNSDDFATTPGVVSRTNNSLNCNNAAFKFDLSSLKALVQVDGSDHVCLPNAVTFNNLSIGGERFFWNFGDGTPIIEQTDPLAISHAFENPGTYTVWLKAFDPGTCRTSDSASVRVYIGVAEATFPDDSEICEGSSYLMSAAGGRAYEWFTKDGSFHSNNPSVSVSPTTSTWYYINVTESFGCTTRDSVFVRVVPRIVPEFTFARRSDCTGESVLSVTNLTDSLMDTDQLYFDFGDGTTSDLNAVEHLYTESGLYNVKLIAVREFCVTESVQPMTFGPLKFPNVITPALEDDKNDTFTIQFGDEPGPSPADFGFKTRVAIYDRWGRLVYENDDYRSDWSGSDLSTGVYYYEVTVQDHATCKGWVHLVK